MNISEFKNQMNTWGQEKVPFLFVVDFEMKKPVIIKLADIDPAKILFEINGIKNTESRDEKPKLISLQKLPMGFKDYQKKFDSVLSHLEYGDSFLTNLTVKTEIELQHSLNDVYAVSRAKYKLLYNNQFLVFSPETFIKIQDGKIFSFPMKGTIDASIPNAEEKILSNQKELSEHVTIVDLIRNDLSLVATEVEVKRFRYIEKIQTHSKALLQVSSEISGRLGPDYNAHLGDILVDLLPAGSISGAPKRKTIEIIEQAEGEKRGFYTGVFGYFNGKNLDSGVMIRFMEKDGGKWIYKSGGGINSMSNAQSEYEELINKIYVPVNRKH